MQSSENYVKGPFEGRVRANEQIGDRFYRIDIAFGGKGGEAFRATAPGQFAEIDLSGCALPRAEAIPADLRDKSEREVLLRRPFSFCDVFSDSVETIVEMLYCVVGTASLRMTTLRAGDRINMIGPVGNGFSIPGNKKAAVLVAGGMGAPPIQHLANKLDREYIDITVAAIAGARNKEQMPFNPERFAKCEIDTIITTDDGSHGLSGFVTEHLEEWLDKSSFGKDETIIYACGPEGMMASASRIANERGIDCQVSMERRMACGIGLCQGCAVECRVGSGETVYKMCCKDGPVFNAKEVVFE